MNFYRIFLLVICVCLAARVAIAQEPMPSECGFSGYIEALGAYISTNSQLNTDSDNKKTDILDTSGERVDKLRPLPLGLLSYTFAEKRTQLFVGILPENVSQGQFLVEAGARHILSNGTGLRSSVIPLTPIYILVISFKPALTYQQRLNGMIAGIRYSIKSAVNSIPGY